MEAWPRDLESYEDGDVTFDRSLSLIQSNRTDVRLDGSISLM